VREGRGDGLKAIDLLNEDGWDVPRRYGLVCSMGYGGGGEIRSGMNRWRITGRSRRRSEEHPTSGKAWRGECDYFSGNRGGMSDAEGTKNTIAGLNRVKKIAEDQG